MNAREDDTSGPLFWVDLIHIHLQMSAKLVSGIEEKVAKTERFRHDHNRQLKAGELKHALECESKRLEWLRDDDIPPRVSATVIADLRRVTESLDSKVHQRLKNLQNIPKEDMKTERVTFTGMYEQIHRDAHWAMILAFAGLEEARVANRQP